MPRIIPSLLAALLLAASIGLPAHAQTNPRDVFLNVDTIRTEDAIHKDEFVDIGGIRQWVSIRGRHADAPILLFIHGGPGFTSIPSSFYYMSDWREYFTVVQWDQRGAGKTYMANNPETVRPTMTIDRMVADAEEMAAYLRKTYNRRKIVLVGFSWGSVVGVKLAQKHPDWFYAYVGTGQFVAARESEAMGYATTLAAARANNNAEAIADLERIAPFPDPSHPDRTIQNLGIERRWLAHYGGYYWRNNVGHEGELNPFSPDYSDEELKVRDTAQGFSIQALWGEVGAVDLRPAANFNLPVIFVQGRHDTGTSAVLIEQWYKTVKAPRKQLIWFEDSGHMAYQEEPGRFLVTLVNDVFPLTQKR